MRTLYSVVLLFIYQSSFAQIEFTDYWGEIITDGIVELWGDEDVAAPFNIKNLTGDTLSLKIERLKLSYTEGSTDFLSFGTIEDGFAYPIGMVSPANPFITPDASIIANEDSCYFNIFYQSNGFSGCSHFRYYMLNEDNTRIDSLDVLFCSTVGIEEEQNLTVSVYPNPATFNVNIQLTKNVNNVNFGLYNVLGGRIMDRKLNAGNNTIDVSPLPNGVYFYFILKDGVLTETKKLVIKH